MWNLFCNIAALSVSLSFPDGVNKSRRGTCFSVTLQNPHL